MTLRLVSDATPGPSLFSDTPTPWRVVRSYTQFSAILDANGHSIFLCPAEVAGRIVAAVNMVECGHWKGAR